jgi:hypothetical protein
MNFKKIVGFGDSWMWGDELLDPSLGNTPSTNLTSPHNTSYREQNCFLGLLGQHYRIPTQNFGHPGGSLQSAIWSYLWWLEHEQLAINECLVLIALTEPSRFSLYNAEENNHFDNPPWNQFVHSTWIRSNSTVYREPWPTTVKNLVALSHCDKLCQLNFDQTVYFFEGQSALHKNILQFNCTNNNKSTNPVSSLIFPDWSLAKLLKHNPDGRVLFAPNYHPNEQGHQLISHHLINYIDSCIIIA